MKKIFAALLLLLTALPINAEYKSPSDHVTVKEALTAVSRLHAAMNGYESENVDFGYAFENGIADEADFSDTDAFINRHRLADLVYNALPESCLMPINCFEEIADVPETNKFYDSVLALYNSGILMGTDRFGTFKPYDNVSFSQLSEVMSRASDKSKRVSFEISDANYSDGVYLVNEASPEFKETSLQNDGVWNYDNRNRTGSISNAANHVYDYYVDGSVELWRYIEETDKGLLAWEFHGNIEYAGNGLKFFFADENGQPLITLESLNGAYYFCGKDTGVSCELGNLYFAMKLDIDEGVSELYVNGKRIGDTYEIPKRTYSSIHISSGYEEISAVKMYRCDVYKDFPVNEKFIAPQGAALSAWLVDGNAEVLTKGGQNYSDTNSAYITSGSSAYKSFKELSGSVIFETYMLLPEDADEGMIEILSGESTVASVKLCDAGVFAHDGTLLRHHTNNIWQCVRMELDTVNGKVLIRINGKNTGTLDFGSAKDSVDGIRISCTSGAVYFDDVSVYMTHIYDDYCPEPVPITDDGYNTILNVCSLWHEGSHSGWGCISAYPDIETALGFYDEGIPEVADWEIKFMVENGIDVQHLCWYCPSSNISEPIKRSGLNFALHDGYFNAKYSDKMKFMFMWENNGTNCYSLEQFKKYIWSYWVDYYFLDDRYYTIDNKIVFTVWSPGNFRKAFGDNDESIAEAVAFMNEDIKKYGFDGVIILFSDSTQSESTLTTHASSGASGVYAYHWGQDGSDADKSIARMAKNLNSDLLHVVPTVSVGFNNLGWSGTRKPMISVEGHNKVLKYMLDTFLPAKEEGWKQNTLIVSTWNEYGEGTYVMPCAGLNGFGYLENVAELVSGVYDHSNNIYPTAQQKARLGHMYPDEKITSLKKHDYELRTYEEVPGKLLYKATGDEVQQLFGLKNVSVNNGVFSATTTGTDSGMVIKDEYKPSVRADDIIAIRMVLKSDVSCSSEIFFTNETISAFDATHRIGFEIEASDDFKEYVIYTDSVTEWTGTITHLRLDTLTKVGSFEFKSIELLGYTDAQQPYSIFVDGTEYMPPFDPYMENGELYVTAEPYEGFFSLHNLYYEWSRFTGRLYIKSRNGSEIVFTRDSDIATVNGKDIKLAKKIEMRDGLPMLPLTFIYENAGIEYDINGKRFDAYGISKERYELIRQRKPFEFEFDVPGDAEGFTASGMTMAVYGGRIHGTAVLRDNAVQPYDAMLTYNDIYIDAGKCTRVLVGLKHNTTYEGSIEMFFLTDADAVWNQSKSANARLLGTSSENIVEYTLDFSSNKKWTGTVTDIRLDPVPRDGSFELDYVRFIFE